MNAICALFLQRSINNPTPALALVQRADAGTALVTCQTRSRKQRYNRMARNPISQRAGAIPGACLIGKNTPSGETSYAKLLLALDVERISKVQYRLEFWHDDVENLLINVRVQPIDNFEGKHVVRIIFTVNHNTVKLETACL
ncbi:MAG: hypothetical protein HYZ01_00555 [Ignavibacteriales bacterium]|nr:hypothetical protein [Ignavibacteriales bacterium]